MKKVISVRFKENGKSYYFDPGDAVIHTGEFVIVEKWKEALKTNPESKLLKKKIENKTYFYE